MNRNKQQFPLYHTSQILTASLNKPQITKRVKFSSDSICNNHFQQCNEELPSSLSNLYCPKAYHKPDHSVDTIVEFRRYKWLSLNPKSSPRLEPTKDSFGVCNPDSWNLLVETNNFFLSNLFSESLSFSRNNHATSRESWCIRSRANSEHTQFHFYVRRRMSSEGLRGRSS